jgi:hypothetical protein
MIVLEKEYFCLKELFSLELVDLKYRQLQNRIKVISKKYEDRKDLIYKKSNRWYIHNSIIIKEFKKKKKIDYKLYGTISSSNKFEINYWKYCIFELNKKLKKVEPLSRLKYVIETNRRNIYHLHFITSFNSINKLKQIIREDYYFDKTNDMNILIKYIWEVEGLEEYFKKENKPVLLK